MSFKNQLKKLIQESKVIRSGLFASKMILNEQDDLDPGNWNWWTGIGPEVGGVIWAPTGYDGDNYAVDSNFSNLSFGDIDGLSDAILQEATKGAEVIRSKKTEMNN